MPARFPDAAATFDTLAEEAATSRLFAGTDYPSDASAGMEISRQVADLAIAHATSDRAGTKWTGSVPNEAGKWNGTEPAGPADWNLAELDAGNRLNRR